MGYTFSKEVIAFQDARQFLSKFLVVSIAPLVPSTTYMLSVCAVFGVGAEVGAGAELGAELGAASSLTVMTAEPVGGTNQMQCYVSEVMLLIFQQRSWSIFKFVSHQFMTVFGGV